MSETVYRRLARHLDKLPAGYPATDSGVELRILKRLFTPEEAQLALHLTLIPEEAGVVALRARLEFDRAEEQLADIAAKGLIFSVKPKGRPMRYMAAQFAIGIWEYHVNDLDPDLIRDVNEYFPQFIKPEDWAKAPQLRTIPVERSVDASLEVMAYEQAEEIIRSQTRIAVAPCICRREAEMEDRGCGKPEESCLVLGWGADYYLRNDLGREIDVDEALEVLARADRAGLVLQPSNARKPTNICCCCGCCCQVLRNLKRQPRPGLIAARSFIAVLDADQCLSCGLCTERCQMDALSLDDGAATLESDRCIGCGLCVTTCPSGALTLERLPGDDQPSVPSNMVESALTMARNRGKLGPARIAGMSLKSKMDRLLAHGRHSKSRN